MKTCTSFKSAALAIWILATCTSTTTASIQKPTNAAFLKPSSSSLLQQQQDRLATHKKKYSKNLDIQGGSSVSGGTATMSNEIFNLVKSIVGAGVLSLPAGIAAFGDAPSAAIPATILITVIGAISAYGFSLIGRVCAVTNSKSYREAWDNTVGTSTSWIAAFSSTFSCLAANLAYSMILADTFQNLLSTIGISLTRPQTLYAVTALVLTPLCLLKDLSSLAPFSLLGIMGMAYTTIAMAMRYLSGSYAAPDGKFLADGIVAPAFGKKGALAVLNPSSFILISMLSTAYMAHFNAPKFFIELENNTIERFNTVVTSSFGISIAIFCAVASIGFLTFGSSSNGLILNNYSNADPIMSMSRVAVALSIVFSYPLVFVGTRDGLLDLANVSMEKRTNSLVNKVTLAALAVITFMALVFSDLSFVLSFTGATLGSGLIYIFPALMFRKMVAMLGDDATAAQKKEALFAIFTALLGVVMGGLGAWMSVKSLSE